MRESRALKYISVCNGVPYYHGILKHITSTVRSGTLAVFDRDPQHEAFGPIAAPMQRSQRMTFLLARPNSEGDALAVLRQLPTKSWREDDVNMLHDSGLSRRDE